MPYSIEHKRKTRTKIVEAARIMFNRHGFDNVTIDMVMAEAGLTRGGFYNHFKSKEDLFRSAVASFLMGRGAQWRDEAGIDMSNLSPEMSRQMIDSYLSADHLKDIDGQCPMIALPSDIARGNSDVQNSYQDLLNAMVFLFERCLARDEQDERKRSLALAAMCVGGMVLARTLPESELAAEVRLAAHDMAVELTQSDSNQI